MKREAGKMWCVGYRPIIHLSTMWIQHFTNEIFIVFSLFLWYCEMKKNHFCCFKSMDIDYLKCKQIHITLYIFLLLKSLLSKLNSNLSKWLLHFCYNYLFISWPLSLTFDLFYFVGIMCWLCVYFMNKIQLS